MTFGEGLLIAAFGFTLVHMVMDVYLTIKHMAHPKDTLLTSVAIIALLGHVVLTGEASEWVDMVRGWA